MLVRASRWPLFALVAVRARPSSMLAETADRLQRHLDAVALSAPPRIELTGDNSNPPLGGLAVLDSSFNPPTRAHLHMLESAASRFGARHSLLLLAKQNADKAVVGASLVQRMEMMETIAACADPPGSVLCGVTAHPLFVDKAMALQALCGGSGSGARIVVLVGFDTWVRIVDPKYYPPDGLNAALRAIFDAVEVAVASRDAASVGNLDPLSADEQEARVRELPEAVTRGRLHFLHNAPEMADLSSSALRKAISDGNADAVRTILPDCLVNFVEERGLYRMP